MSILINSSVGDITVDLFVDICPTACLNFLKLCKIKYYNNCLIYQVQANHIVQTGDPTGTGSGGSSIFGLLTDSTKRFFDDECTKSASTKLNRVGLVCMAHYGSKENCNASQFFITLRGEDLSHFEQTHHTVIGEVVEGLDVLEKINKLYCDEDGRPYLDVRLLHTFILDDPFPDPPNLISSGLLGSQSPERTFPEEETIKRRLPYESEEAITAINEEETELQIKRKEAKSRAIVLEMTGDLPDAEVKPPDEVLFVCKLNPVTTDEDLELIFSRFGTIKSCEVIRDHKTGDSLNFAFIEFETEAACVQAYEKMNNVLIDDRRIKVDFSQSVSKLWNKYLLKPRKAQPIKPLGRDPPPPRGPNSNSASSHYHHHPNNNNSNQQQQQQQAPRPPLRERQSSPHKLRLPIPPPQAQQDGRDRDPSAAQSRPRTASARRERDRELSRSRPRSVARSDQDRDRDRDSLRRDPSRDQRSISRGNNSNRNNNNNNRNNSPPPNVRRSASRLRSSIDGRSGYDDEPYGNESSRQRRDRHDEPVRRRASYELESDNPKRGRVETAGQ